MKKFISPLKNQAQYRSKTMIKSISEMLSLSVGKTRINCLIAKFIVE